MKVIAIVLAVSAAIFIQSRPVSAAVDPGLKKAITDAQLQLTKDTAALNVVRERLQADFETQDDWKNGLAAQEKADADVKTATEPVVAELMKNPEYKAALENRDRAKAELEALNKPETTATIEQRTAASNAYFAANGKVKAMEQNALNTAPAVMEARNKLAASKQALKQLKAKFDEQVKNNPDVEAAQKLVDEDKTKLQDAQKALATAQETERKTLQQQRQQRTSTPRPSPTPRASGGAGY